MSSITTLIMPAEEVTIREAREGDFGRIFVIMKSLMSIHLSDDDLTGLEKSFEMKFLEILQSDKGCFFVAESGEEVVGFISGAPPLALWNIREREMFMIEELAVREDLRSNGLGSLLIEFFRDYAKKQGYKRIAASSHVARERAHNFYLKNGFAKEEFVFVKDI